MTGPVDLLQSLGLSMMEARVYCELLSQPGASGYRIAQRIGKPQANTYAALQTLVTKGAVLAGLERPRRYRAVPIAEFLGLLRADFENRCTSAEAQLTQIEPEEAEPQLLRLDRAEQVFQRALSMIAAARRTLVFTLFPTPFERLAGDLAIASARLGQGCAGLAVSDEALGRGVNVGVSRVAKALLERTTLDHLTVVADAGECLLAAFERGTERLLRASWTNDVYLSYELHSGVVSDTILHTSPLIEEIGSPNLHLLGTLPPSLPLLGRPAIEQA